MAFHDFIRDEAGWATLHRETLFEHPYLAVEQVRVYSPARPEPYDWTVCQRKAGVVVAAESLAGGFVLVRQERVAVRATLWEFPAGQIDQGGVHGWKDVLETGLRELQEEAGYEAGADAEVVPIHHFLSSPGFTDEHCYQIWVKGAVPSALGVNRDANERITEVRLFTPSELRAMVASGEIRDANTLCCLARLSALGMRW